MLVFAFDRDWTVDVNPHPRHDAVPLGWVRHLAHDTPHAVYAIGNQTLAEEAAIPGVVDIVGRHPDDWDEWLGEKQPDGRYEQFPLRRERLSLIADLHPDADGYVVVDDLDLSDVDVWEHYHVWEFVPAVERGEIHPDLPWVRGSGTDDGCITAVDIDPKNPSRLSKFIEDHAEMPGFELTYTKDGDQETQILQDVSIVRRTVTLAIHPVIRCTPAVSDPSTFTVETGSIESLCTIEPLQKGAIPSPATQSDEAAAILRLAKANPEMVSLPSLVLFLGSQVEDLERNQGAIEALGLVATARPEECSPAVPVIQSLLIQGTSEVATTLLAALHQIGEVDPEAIVPLTAELVPYLQSDVDSVRREATRCIAAIADDYPDNAVDAVPALATIVEDDADGLQYAVYALSRITREYPEEVKPVAETLGEVTLRDSLSDSVRLNATAGLGRIVGEYPSIAVEIVDDVATLFDADNPKLRNNAIGLIGDVAVVHTDVVEPYTEEMTALLTAEDTYTRINASGALSRVAEDFPDSVEHVTPTFVELLSDENPLVRENACWALGHLCARDATSALEDRAHGDDNADVRTRASWALAQINE